MKDYCTKVQYVFRRTIDEFAAIRNALALGVAALRPVPLTGRTPLYSPRL